MARKIYVLRFERGSAHAYACSRTLQVRFSEVNVSLLIALRAARLTGEANRVHSTIMIIGFPAQRNVVIPRFVHVQTLRNSVKSISISDQLPGRIAPGMRVLDAGCGSGNLIYLFAKDMRCRTDSDPRPWLLFSAWLRVSAPALTADNSGGADRSDVVSRFLADVVLSSAVLHFARGDAHFGVMLRGT
jgi:hypothetical protein